MSCAPVSRMRWGSYAAEDRGAPQLDPTTRFGLNRSIEFGATRARSRGLTLLVLGHAHGLSRRSSSYTPRPFPCPPSSPTRQEERRAAARRPTAAHAAAAEQTGRAPWLPWARVRVCLWLMGVWMGLGAMGARSVPIVKSVPQPGPRGGAADAAMFGDRKTDDDDVGCRGRRFEMWIDRTPIDRSIKSIDAVGRGTASSCAPWRALRMHRARRGHINMPKDKLVSSLPFRARDHRDEPSEASIGAYVCTK